MTDRKTDYSYAANANLVLKADRKLIGKRSNEPTGEAESLYGRINKADFGSRARVETVKVTKKPKVEKIESLGDSMYKPQTRQTLEAWQLILVFLSRYLGDVDQQTLNSCADEVLVILKQDGKDLDKLKEVENILGKIPTEEFAQLVVLGNKITDYAVDQEDQDVNDEGVAVVFDEDQEEEQFEVLSDQESDAEEQDAGRVIQSKDYVFENQTEVKTLQATDIDAFWLQRTIAR